MEGWHGAMRPTTSGIPFLVKSIHDIYLFCNKKSLVIEKEKSETNDYNIARVEYKQGNKVPLMLLLLAGCAWGVSNHTF